MSGDISQFDICECGDYRADHKNGKGPCKFNNDESSGGLNHGFKKCSKFRFMKVASENDPNVRKFLQTPPPTPSQAPGQESKP